MECLTVRGRKFLSKKAYQSLFRKLLCIQKCVKPSGIFVNRIVALLRTCGGPRIARTHDFYKDLYWFVCFLLHFNDVKCLKRIVSCCHRSCI